MPVLVEGRLSIRSYESKTGEKHKAAEVVMSFVQMLNRRSGSDIGNTVQVEDELEATPDRCAFAVIPAGAGRSPQPGLGAHAPSASRRGVFVVFRRCRGRRWKRLAAV